MSSHDSFVASGNSPTHSGKIQPDFAVENHGGIFLLNGSHRAAGCHTRIVKGKSLLLSQIYLKEYPPYGIFAEHKCRESYTWL